MSASLAQICLASITRIIARVDSGELTEIQALQRIATNSAVVLRVLGEEPSEEIER